jgi:hypothetical protein
MFSVGLLYSIRDFLNLNLASGMTPETFAYYFNSYKYSTADKILSTTFKCGWAKINAIGNMELTERGEEIAKCDYKAALLIQLEDIILNFNPVWASVLSKGRIEAKSFLPPDAFQCFKEAGLFDSITDYIVDFWDKLSLAYRNYTYQRQLEIGRIGEKLSFEYELKRTGKAPLWQAVESNLAGYDLLSIVDISISRRLKIEVKSTTSDVNLAKFHITKNEWQTALASENYIFHLWQISEPKLFIVSLEAVRNHIATNNGDGKWDIIEIPFNSVIR